MLLWMFAFVGGVALALWQAEALFWGWTWTGMLLGGVGSVWLVMRRRRRKPGSHSAEYPQLGLPNGWLFEVAFSIFVVACGSALGWGWTQLQVSALQHAWANRAIQQTETVEVTGVIDSLPQQRGNVQQWVLAVESFQREGQATSHAQTLRVRVNDRTGLPVQAGERWRIALRWKPLHVAMNPGLRDGHVYVMREQLDGQAQVVQVSSNTRLAHAPNGRWILAIRQWLMQRLQSHVPASEAQALMIALLIGEQSVIEDEEWEVYRRTGIAHLISVSGMHVTLFAWLAQKGLGAAWRWLGQRFAWVRKVNAPTVGFWAGMALALFYAHVAGWGVPAQRTWLMLALFSGLRSVQRPWPWPVVWAATLVWVLVWDPWALWSAGLWLSFVAVAMLFMQVGGEVQWSWTWLQMLKYLGAVLRMQLLMTFSLAPLTAWLMGQVSVLGMVANLFAVPWITFGVLPLTFLGVLFTPLWTLGAALAQGLITALAWVSSAPTGAWMVSVPPLWIAAMASSGWVLASLPGPVAWRLWCVTWALPWLLWRPSVPDWGQFRVVAWEVGQGSAVWIQTRNHGLIYDTGASYPSGGSAARSVVIPSLQAQGLRPNAIVISHADNDHAGGWFDIQHVWPQAESITSYDTLRSTLCLAGTSWEWDGVRFRFLHPSMSDVINPHAEDNDKSCVLHVQALKSPQASAMLSGDAGVSVEDRLVRMGWVPAVDLMVAGHHGSHTSSGALWMQALQPKHIWVQAGHDNRYGHPHPSVTQRWNDAGMTWWATPQTGALHFDSAYPQSTESERERRKRSWHLHADLPMSRN